MKELSESTQEKKISDIIIMVDPTRVKEDDDDRDGFNYWFFVT